MQCLRCGYCCCFLDVIIIKPEAIKPNGKVDLDKEKSYQYKSTGVECPHLTWDGENAVCGVHQYPWFKETPCHDFKQIEAKDLPCRLGSYFREHKEDMRERLRRTTQIGEGAGLLNQ